METAGDTTIDENGDRVPAPSYWQYAGRCREESNGKGECITTADFKTYKFSSLIQMPAGTEKIDEGIRILVSAQPLDPNGIDDGFLDESASSVRLIGTCAKFDEGRLHCRLWV